MRIVGKHYLAGDAPGAAPIVLVCGNKKLVIPRCLLMSIVTSAMNQASYEGQKLKAQSKPADELETQNLLDAINWHDEIKSVSDQLLLFLKS